MNRIRRWRQTYAFNTIRCRFEPRRPDGPDVDVADLHTKWQRLHDLAPSGPDACGHDDECDEYLERNTAVNNAVQSVSQRQEGRVFRSLTVYPQPTLMARRWTRRNQK